VEAAAAPGEPRQPGSSDALWAQAEHRRSGRRQAPLAWPPAAGRRSDALDRGSTSRLPLTGIAFSLCRSPVITLDGSR